MEIIDIIEKKMTKDKDKPYRDPSLPRVARIIARLLLYKIRN